MASIIKTERYIIGKATDLACDPAGGKWTRICLIHQTIFNFPTKQRAQWSSEPYNDGCEDCEWQYLNSQLCRSRCPIFTNAF